MKPWVHNEDDNEDISEPDEEGESREISGRMLGQDGRL